eukprot:364691-Chlamydomonas_euryale.AAC.3
MQMWSRTHMYAGVAAHAHLRRQAGAKAPAHMRMCIVQCHSLRYAPVWHEHPKSEKERLPFFLG